jgi:hypothetical protein
MKLVESSDGSITVIELDPTKLHWIIIEDEGPLRPDMYRNIRMVDGQIILKQPATKMTVVEGEELPVGFVPFTPEAP